MKISNLYKVNPKKDTRTSGIGDYLEREIGEIVDKKRFDDDYEDPYYQSDLISGNLNRGYNSSRERRQGFNNNNQSYYGNNLNNNVREDYLPFNKEEIRPIINESINSGKIDKLILETIMPHIEDWLDDNLEKIAQKTVKQYILAKERQRENDREEEDDAYESRYSKRNSSKYDRR